jgi:signal transduction histidine kinase
MVQNLYAMFSLLQYVLLVVVATISLTTPLDLSRWQWWVMAGLFVALGILYQAWPRRRYHLFLAAEILLLVGLMALNPNTVMLGFTFSAHAAILFPSRAGALWIALFAALSAVMLVYHDGLLDGLMLALLVSAGCAAFGALQYARERAEAARRESQSLLVELQEAHRQLQRYSEQVEELTLVRERQRLAREIHDTLAQGFTSIVMHLEAAEAALLDEARRPPLPGVQGDMEALQQHLDQARGTARESLAQARRLVWALRPEILEGTTLADALKRVAARWTDESGICATVSVTGTAYALPPEVEVTLLRAAQEALTNVRKHARAGQVTVTLSYMGDLVVLDVQDNGVGFDPARLSTLPGTEGAGGFGLTAMRERVEQLGGTLLVETVPGEGTTLVVEIPLPVGRVPPDGVSSS